MNSYENKVEELREKRSDALNGIVSSQQTYNEIRNGEDQTSNDFLFGGHGNNAGVLELLSLYQQERICEKDISYFIEDLGISNVESKASIDINNAMNSTADTPRFSTNYFYYIDNSSNISVNEGNNILSAKGKFINTQTFLADDKPISFSVGDLVYYDNEYDTIESIDDKTIIVTTMHPTWTGNKKTLQNLKTRNSIIFNNGEPYYASDMETRAETVANDLGETYTGSQTIYVEEESPYAVLESSINRGSGFLKYWGSRNEVSGNHIGGDDKIWIWHATDTRTYRTKEHISSLLADLETLKDKITALINILSSIKEKRDWISSTAGQEFWGKMSIPADTITSGQITNVTNWANALSSCFAALNSKKDNDYDWDGRNEPDNENFRIINGAINSFFNIYGNESSGLGKFLKDRFSKTSDVLDGKNNIPGLRKWVNFWFTEKISLEDGTYTSLNFLLQSIADEEVELNKAEAKLREVVGSDNKVIPTPNILAAYSEPRFDKVTGQPIENRLGVVWDGQLHGKKYVVLRKNIKAFDYYSTSGNFAFKWDNSNWTTITGQKGDWSKPVTEIDPESGLVKTEILEPITDDEFYIFRVYEEDVNPILLTSINSSYPIAYSKQSKMFDEDSKKRFINISDGVVYCKNHGFKRGNAVLIDSDVTDPNVYRKNPISGFYRVLDADENSFVLEGLPHTNYGGYFYKAFGVVSVKPLPYVSYDSSGKPSLS